MAREKDVLDTTEATESFILATKTMAMKKVLLEAMKTVCCERNNVFRCLHERHNLHGSKDLTESVELLFPNLLRNLRRSQHLQNSKYDYFNSLDIDKFCVFNQWILKRGGKVHIFCSALLFVSIAPSFHSNKTSRRVCGGNRAVFSGENASILHSSAG